MALPDTPFKCGAVTVHAWGDIVDDPAYSKPATAPTRPHSVFPAGYHASVKMTSYRTPGTDVTMNCKIRRGEVGPVFEVTAEDDPENPAKGPSASAVFQTIVQRRTDGKSVSMNGVAKYGLNVPQICDVIRKLPGADEVYSNLTLQLPPSLLKVLERRRWKQRRRRALDLPILQL